MAISRMSLERSPEQASGGFSASLMATSLADLVQMECLSGNACVARVTSGDDVGYLYFRGGRIVHAMSPSNVGEPAALEILSWSSGAFEMCNAGWPGTETIDSTVQGLLLRAAQARDESSHDNLLRFPRLRPEPEQPGRARGQVMNDPSEVTPTIERPPANGSGPASGVTRVQAAARIDANGAVLTTKGAGSAELADAMALAVRLARLIGDDLGLDRLVAIEGASPSVQTLVIVEKSGGVVGMRAPSDVDLASVRERYGV